MMHMVFDPQNPSLAEVIDVKTEDVGSFADRLTSSILMPFGSMT